MADRILLLPDNIANQIAAGEVIQRPASAIKELLENAVDAGATEIKLIINDAGKSLIQVIDNGSGMSETDARMCFERHATSKIKNIDDLFHVRTMGFRGEALASIAAVAQVELRTRKADAEVGTYIEIENSVVTKQEPVAAPVGTSIAMKNLFFNVPARRNFLKRNAAEMRHIIDEFMRVALSFPNIFFSLTSNGQQLFHLDAGTLKHRVVQLLGNNYNTKLVSVKEHTDYLNIYGFVGKPETAKKTRGDQYFFVNNRFIKSGYLNHAVMSAYQEMIAPDSFPMYVLFIDLDPTQVDVNVHPTKQEIKFEDEKIVYAFVQAAIKHALAQFSITPTLDFDLDASIQGLESVQKPFTEEDKSSTQSSSIFQSFTQANQAHAIEPGRGAESLETGLQNWRSDLGTLGAGSAARELGSGNTGFGSWSGGPGSRGGSSFGGGSNLGGFPMQDFKSPSNERVEPVDEPPFIHRQSSLNSELQSSNNKIQNAFLTQLFFSYILLPSENGFLLIHQQSAHERIIYERLQQSMQGKPIATQRSLFPSTIELTPGDAVLLTELLPSLQQMGYTIEPFGKNAFVIQGAPADVVNGNEKVILEKILEQYKHFNTDLRLSKREMLLRSVAAQQAIKAGVPLNESEMQHLVAELFTCGQPNTTPSGRPTYMEFKKDQLDKMFGR
ncbi:DNA mismatch repair endonuclease MutL [Chitinophagaceae bacterium LB-8]|uniref:DNA mismatch repair protein MutL n=1 Tax=Paraflavisolibacter caeni TaxID=2982496 RepID=A0A9X2XPH5_9BACT|nr:DNA mismatch repair endonuclease MutL [Paraflavisolibacter caeni]MCU7550904.1 DNA mismatch repair endonuclease MutL [Paraflavisolibacter caeni]